jgi:capsular polysaccharide biosynthesis protein
MELRRYLKIVRRWKWVVVLTFVATMGGTAALVLPQAWQYQSTGTWLIRSRFPGNDANASDAMDQLSRDIQIGASYAMVARGPMIRDRAEGRLAPGEDTTGVDVSADLVTDTNILSISVHGPDPTVDRDLADAVGQETASYVYNLNDPFILSAVDHPTVADSPVGPNKVLLLMVGGLFGVVVGFGLATFAEYLQGPVHERALRRLVSASILRDRVRVEMARADAAGLPLTLGVLKLTRGDRGEPDVPPTREELRRVHELLRPNVHGEVTVAHIGAGEFAAIFPDVGRAEAKEIMARWKSLMSIVLQADAREPGPKLRVGVCEYTEGRLVGDAVTTGVLRRLMEGFVELERPEPVRVESPAQQAPARRQPDERGNGKPDRKPAETTPGTTSAGSAHSAAAAPSTPNPARTPSGPSDPRPGQAQAPSTPPVQRPGQTQAPSTPPVQRPGQTQAPSTPPVQRPGDPREARRPAVADDQREADRRDAEAVETGKARPPR